MFPQFVNNRKSNSSSSTRIHSRRTASLSIVLCAVISMFAAMPVFSAEGEPERQFVLEGLNGVHIIVPSITGLKIDRSDIVRAVEERIKAAGMKAIDDNEYLNNTDVKSLVVRLVPLKQGGKTFYSLNLDLTQMIRLPDKQSRKVDVSMWDDVMVGLVDSNKEGRIKEDILTQVEKFIDMWRRANGMSGVKKPS